MFLERSEVPVELSEIGYMLEWEVPLNEFAVYSDTWGWGWGVGRVYEVEVTGVGCIYG